MHGQARRSRLEAAPVRRWRALCGFTLALLIAVGHATQARAEAIYSKSRRFRIPFQFDSSELKRLGASEVQLFVSRDGGGRWGQGESVSPETAKFTFEAPVDGEYWFSVKTRTSSGLEYPAGPHQPGLQVIVDTLPPKLELQLSETEPGRVRMSWNASDDNIDLSTLQLEFFEPDGTQWQSVSVRAQEQGETTWTSARSGTMLARGSVSDKAGHKTEVSAETQVSAFVRPQDNLPDFNRPIAALPRPENVIANAPLTSTTPGPGSLSVPSQLTSAPTNTAPVLLPGSTTEAQPAVPSTSKPALTNKQGAHVVNSLEFRVGYQIEDVGPSGVGSVELYITEDRGAMWYHYGNDPDRTSPVEISVPTDGEYGFTFRVSNGLGFVAQPPQPGDRPDVTVVVDRNPPVVKMLPPQAGQGAKRDQVLIEWTIEERELDPRPIAIYYATHTGGPWETIQGWQPSNGRFLWTAPANLEQPVYLRLEVRDAAGNITRVDSEKPLLIDRARPRVHVTDVESLRVDQR